MTTDVYARSLWDNGRFEEAERLFRQAIELQAQGGSPAIQRIATMLAYVRNLVNNGRIGEVGPLLQQAIELLNQSDGHANLRANLMAAYAGHLVVEGRFVEAEPLLVQAIQDFSATAASERRERLCLAQAQEIYAQGLRQAGRPLEADAMEASAKTLRDSLSSG